MSFANGTTGIAKANASAPKIPTPNGRVTGGSSSSSSSSRMKNKGGTLGTHFAYVPQTQSSSTKKEGKMVQYRNTYNRIMSVK